MPVHVHLADFLSEYVAPYVTETEALEIAIELGQTVTLAYGNYDPEDLTAPIGWATGVRDKRSETLPGIVARAIVRTGVPLDSESPIAPIVADRERRMLRREGR